MKTIAFTLLSFLFLTVSAESHYLQIKYKSENVSYPPNTLFELYDDSGKLIYTQDNLPDSFTFNESHKLVLHPTYKSEEDVYVLKAATLLRKVANLNHQSKSYKNHRYTSNSVSAQKEVMESNTRKGSYNLTLSFENGLIFNYTDGKTDAFLDDEKLKVVGNYIIDSKLGRFKISFRPNNGETWWVFEQKK